MAIKFRLWRVLGQSTSSASSSESDLSTTTTLYPKSTATTSRSRSRSYYQQQQQQHQHEQQQKPISKRKFRFPKTRSRKRRDDDYYDEDGDDREEEWVQPRLKYPGKPDPACIAALEAFQWKFGRTSSGRMMSRCSTKISPGTSRRGSLVDVDDVGPFGERL